ncbi:hypothetical protein F5Y19DRAFT_25287 [Xylariaceae sp. FL1651]|nr:hypothetical protein F5Y19DRAFT_25287 [Xylariaceae sp. FL1651]
MMKTAKAVPSAFSQISLTASPPMRPNQQYDDDDESQQYNEDDQRQSFLKPKEGQQPRSTFAATTRSCPISVYLVTAVVACAVILIGAGSILLSRLSTSAPGDGSSSQQDNQNLSEHAMQLLSTLISTPEPAHFRMQSPCGSTPEEALARGCKFDLISFCWLPDECYDSELVETFEAMRTWEYYADSERTEPVSREELLAGRGDGLYVTWEYHLRHCAFMWMKLHRAILARGKPNMPEIDSYIASLNHTNHCTTILLTDRDVAFSTLNTETLVKYPHCGML